MEESDFRASEGRLKSLSALPVFLISSVVTLATTNLTGNLCAQLTGGIADVDCGAFASFAVTEDTVLDIVKSRQRNILDDGSG